MVRLWESYYTWFMPCQGSNPCMIDKYSTNMPSSRKIKFCWKWINYKYYSSTLSSLCCSLWHKYFYMYTSYLESQLSPSKPVVAASFPSIQTGLTQITACERKSLYGIRGAEVSVQMTGLCKATRRPSQIISQYLYCPHGSEWQKMDQSPGISFKGIPPAT